MAKEFKHTRESDKRLIDLKPHPETPQYALEILRQQQEEARERMALRKIETEAIGVEVRHMIASKLKNVAEGTLRPRLPNGEVDGREGWQYLYENSSNSKNEVATMAMLTTGTDPSNTNNVNIAILSRVKSTPVSVDELDALEITVEKSIEE